MHMTNITGNTEQAQAALPATSTAVRPPHPSRILSVDMLRGLVMVIMALDHTRDYFSSDPLGPENMATTSGALFFARWITHFCAPAFFFLAGMGAYLGLGRGKSPSQVSRFFWTRGLWLVFLELTIIGFAWSFRLGVATGNVIWALGWSMVLMALIVRLPVRWVGGLGLALVLLHNLVDRIDPATFGPLHWLWTVLHVPGSLPLPGFQTFSVVYPLVPWVGVMALGYAFGSVFRRPPEERQRTIFLIGAAATAGFVLLRATGFYGNVPADLGFGMTTATGPWLPQKTLSLTIVSFFNVQKYPPSLQFLLMTLGPTLMILSAMDRWSTGRSLNTPGRWLLVFGRVPMFYYVLHLFLIRLLTLLVTWMCHQPYEWLLRVEAFEQRPSGFGHGLPFIYAMWALVILLLYAPCAWFGGVKKKRKDWWLSYL